MSSIFHTVLFSVFIYSSAAFAESDYAAKCQQVIGVPVPDVDCSDPAGSEVPVGRREGGRCETPSYGLSGCNPGTRFIRFDDTITRNGHTEKITTMIMCRKTNHDTIGGPGRDIYGDIGVIQYNETKHATCWFSSTSRGQRPTKRIGDRMAYPSPSTRNGESFWGNSQPEATCIECHQNGVFMRTPFAAGVGAQAGKGHKRTGGTGSYQPGDGNNIPFSRKFSQRGLACSVGKPAWNRPNGTDAPYPIKINREAYDSKFPARTTGEGGRADACTRCHYIGSLVGGQTLNCQSVVNEFTGAEPFSLRLANANHFWMPPTSNVQTTTQMQERFGRGLAAVGWCCNAANRANREYQEICGNKFDEGDDEAETNVLTALRNRGPCALCPDCDEALGRAHAGGDSTTH